MAAAKIRIDVVEVEGHWYADLVVRASGRRLDGEDDHNGRTQKGAIKKAKELAAAFERGDECIYVNGVKLTQWEKKEAAKNAK